MQNLQLNKGTWYVSLSDGLWSIGQYIGKSPTHYMFLDSNFSRDAGWIGKGIKFEDADKHYLIAVPTKAMLTEMAFMAWLQSVLPQ